MTVMRCGWMGLLAAVCACAGAPSGVQSAASGDNSSGSNHPPAPADPCAGLLPTMPPPKTFTITAANGGGFWCSGATTDGAGNVYLMGYRKGVRNIALGGMVGGDAGGDALFAPLAEGFTGFYQQMSPATTYSAYAPDGHRISSVPVFAYSTVAGVQANGGTILVGCTPTNKAVEARKFDDRAALTTVQLTGQECLNPNGAAVLVDQQDRTLVVRTLDSPTGGVPSGHFAARWFDAGGMPLTGWFDVGAAPSTESYVGLQPLIGGGAVLWAAGEWKASFVSGTADVKPVPAFLSPGTGFAIVRGGKAYAVFSKDPLLTIYVSGGESCGTLATNGANRIGKDGTLIRQTGDAYGYNDCVTTWYPQALK
jgi:hypothetical protein